MKRKIVALGALLAVIIASCSKKDTIAPTPVDAPEVSIENLLAETAVAQEDTLYFKAKVTESTTYTWSVDGKVSGTDSVFKFVSSDLGAHSISLVASKQDKQASAQTNITVYGKYKYGTFILNEGNMTSENGSLIFISPKGKVTDSAYFRANGSFLGNVTQDLFIHNGKMYIISQNGKTNAVGAGFENDGMLVVANAETLKKEAAYNDELSALSWPTHVAVLNEQNVILRDNAGLYRFNTTTKALTFIKGSKSAAKSTMAVSNNKVFAAAGAKVYVVEADKDTISYGIDMKASVTGVVKANDGNIWVATTGSPNKISKINYRDYSVIKANDITTGNVGNGGFAATPGITAKGDTLYFSNLGTKIYRHVFSINTTEFLVDAKTMVNDANIVYNTIAVHPITGEVYLNTIKGYGLNFLINNISVFNFSGKTPKLSANYQDYTHFPAGIFFTYNFE
ncbi:MAG: DUF5074 domain-containing protein [Niabella sp.]